MSRNSFDLSRRHVLAGAGLTATTLCLASRAGSATAEPATPEPRDDAGLVHPGLLHSASDLDRMRTGVAEGREPLLSSYRALAADRRSRHDYTVRNTGQVTTWGRGPTDFTAEAAEDAAAAYHNALMWAVTQDERHALKAREVLDSWSHSLTAITGADGQLGAGLQGFKLVNAAEILRHTWDGWDTEAVAAAERSFRHVWYPAVGGYALFANGNWDVAALQTVLAIGVFCDDQGLVDDALRYAVAGAGNGRLTYTIVDENGQGQESGRSQGYAQLAVGLQWAVAEVAWHQGIDLYAHAGDRLRAGYEYVARYNVGADVAFAPDLDRTGKYLKTSVSPQGRGQFRPIYEGPVRHYVNRLQGAMPWTEQAMRHADGQRVIEGYSEDHPGWGGLTFAGTPALDRSGSGVPATPRGVVAEPYEGRIQLSWSGCCVPGSGAPASGYVIRRAEQPQGPYRTVARGVEGTRWVDGRAVAGGVYHYTVTAQGASGSSAPSAPVAQAAGLPRPWHSQDIGDVRPKGHAHWDGTRLQVEAGGREIAGLADSFHFTHLPLRGDGSITTRVVHPLSSQYATVGVMARAGTAADAAHAAMVLQGLPLHTWSGVWITRRGAGKQSTATGAEPVPPTQQRAITVEAGFPISDLGNLPTSATPLSAPTVEGASDGYRLRRPCWLRLTRRGDLFTGELSTDGQDWVGVGSTRIRLPRDLQVGIAVCSGLGVPQPWAETTTATFDHVVVTGSRTNRPQPAAAATDLEARATDSAIELDWTTHDHASAWTVHRAVRAAGPYEVVADDVEAAAFGVRRTWTDASAQPGRDHWYAVSPSGGGPRSVPVQAVMPSPPAPEPAQEVILGSVGTAIDQVLSVRHDPVLVEATGLPAGLVLDPDGRLRGVPRSPGRTDVDVRASNRGGTGTARLVIDVTQPPSGPWRAEDIGDRVADPRALATQGVALIRRPGRSSLRAEQLELTAEGAGVDVIGQGWTGHMLWQPAEADVVVTACLDVLSEAGSAARAGVVLAKTGSPFDQLAAVVVRPVATGWTPQLITRPRVAARLTTTEGPPTQGSHLWLRLTRRGSSFEAGVSRDGESWTILGEHDVPTFGQGPYRAGLLLTSGTRGHRVTALFKRVAISSA